VTLVLIGFDFVELDDGCREHSGRCIM
jgi:hypothetical protein